LRQRSGEGLDRGVDFFAVGGADAPRFFLFDELA
jgi:hypothetical protein